MPTTVTVPWRVCSRCPGRAQSAVTTSAGVRGARPAVISYGAKAAVDQG
ncbi:hypothetical protein M2157_004778 [Streptomyces sp. SAI-127]|nr:hypothetical protein [Streptomyces sp. SAI-127]